METQEYPLLSCGSIQIGKKFAKKLKPLFRWVQGDKLCTYFIDFKAAFSHIFEL